MKSTLNDSKAHEVENCLHVFVECGMGKRGVYKKTKSKLLTERPANFFKKEHENQGHYVTWADAIDRGNNTISVLYKIQGEEKQIRTPRWKTAWFDDKGLDNAKLAVEEWKKSNNNSTGKGKLLPGFYLKQRKSFLKWLSNTTRPSTIAGYEAALEQYVFPFMVDHLSLSEPKKWTQESIQKWDSSLGNHIPEASSRNRKRTAFNRYLRFLFHKNEIKVIPQILFESVRRSTKETIIPGDLPQWTDAVNWLKTLPSGRFRFIRAVSIGFGLRISEAFAIEEDDFIGGDYKEDLLVRNNFVSRLVEKGIGALFLEVTKAEKKKVPLDILKILGQEENDEPKSGPYTACCTSKEMAEFIIKLISNGEHKEEMFIEKVYKDKANLPQDSSGFKFHEYNPHDDRRLNITLQCLDMSTDVNDFVEICCQLHGQSSRDVFSRYFQWGQMQRRLNRKGAGKLSVLT